MSVGNDPESATPEGGVEAVQEIDLVPQPEPRESRTLTALAIGVLLVVALLGGAYVLASDDSTEVDIAAEDVAATDDSSAEEDSAAGDEPASTTVEPEPIGAEEDESESEATTPTTVGPSGIRAEGGADAAVFGGGPGGVVATDDGFVNIGWGPDGQVVETSSDGLTWTSAPVTGFPGDGGLMLLSEHEGTYVAVYEEWPHFDEAEPQGVDRFFGPPETPKQYFASSTDLENWTLTPFPEIDVDSEYPVYISVSGLAIGESGIAATIEAYPEGPNEMRILYEAGMIDEDALEAFCGSDFGGPDEAIVFYTCDFEAMDAEYERFEEAMAELETDEEREALEREFESSFEEPEQDILVTVEPGTALHGELMALYDFDYEAEPSKVVSGPVGGPFVVSELSQLGYPAGIVSVDDEFIVLVQEFNRADSQTTALRSVDGRSFAVAGAIESWGVNSVSTIGSNIVVVGSGDPDGGATSAWTSSDSGESWSEVPIGTGLYGAWAQAASGPGGIAVMVTGSLEPFPEYIAPIVTLEKDGFSFITGLEGGIARLVGPDGATIHELSEEQLYGSEGRGVEGVLRTEGRFDSTLIFLAPDTGEDLVSFTEEDWEAAYDDVDFVEPDFEEPDYATEAWFSPDGAEWSRIDINLGDGFEGGTELVAVGDDEILFVEYTWVEPPPELFAFEEEGRDPTDDEIAALDEWFGSNNGGGSSEWIRVPIA